VPLETTVEQLVDLCGSDVYRVYAIDDVGKVLDYVTTIDVTRDARELRNAAPDQPMLGSIRALPSASSDLRFALEAMAQMMRTNSEALRAVTESQADWVKAIAVAKGLPRNVAFPPTRLQHDDDDEIKDAEYDEQIESEEEENAAAVPRAATNAYDVVCKAIDKFGDFIPGQLVSTLTGGAATKKKPSGNGNAAAQSSDVDWELANAPDLEMRDLLDPRYSHRKGKAKRAAKAMQEAGGAQDGSSAESSNVSTLREMLARDPALMKLFNAAQAQLTPEEIQLVTSEVMALTPGQLQTFADRMKALANDEAVAVCRDIAANVKANKEKTGESSNNEAA